MCITFSETPLDYVKNMAEMHSFFKFAMCRLITVITFGHLAVRDLQ